MTVKAVQCRAKCKATQQQCRRWATTGATVCVVHGAGAPQVKRNAARRVAQAKATETLNRAGLGQGRTIVDPAEAMLDLVAGAAWNVQIFEDAIASMRAEVGEFGARDTVVLQLHGQGAVTVSPNALFELYGAERDRLAKWSLDCRKAGVEERRVQITADQGRQLAAALRGVVTGVLSLVRASLTAGTLTADRLDVIETREASAVLVDAVQAVRVRPEQPAIGAPTEPTPSR